MTMYQSITPQQEPFDTTKLDGQGRVVFSFNITCVKAPSVRFAREIVSVLVNAGVGVFGKTIFSSSKSELPQTGTIITVTETGGLAPLKTHNVTLGVAYQRPSAMIHVHSEFTEQAVIKAYQAYTALSRVKNQDITA